jgi:hypothetical protein
MADKLARDGSAAILWGPEPALPLLGSIAQLVTKKWADRISKKLSTVKALDSWTKSLAWGVEDEMAFYFICICPARSHFANIY